MDTVQIVGRRLGQKNRFLAQLENASHNPCRQRGLACIVRGSNYLESRLQELECINTSWECEACKVASNTTVEVHTGGIEKRYLSKKSSIRQATKPLWPGMLEHSSGFTISVKHHHLVASSRPGQQNRRYLSTQGECATPRGVASSCGTSMAWRSIVRNRPPALTSASSNLPRLRYQFGGSAKRYSSRAEQCSKVLCLPIRLKGCSRRWEPNGRARSDAARQHCHNLMHAVPGYWVLSPTAMT